MQEHAWDYEQVGATEALQQLLRERPDVRVLAIGLDLGLDDPRVEQLPWQPYERLPALLARCSDRARRRSATSPSTGPART